MKPHGHAARWNAAVAALQAMAADMGRTPTRDEWRATKPPEIMLYRTQWTVLVAAAGLSLAPGGRPVAEEPCACGQPVQRRIVVPCGGGVVELDLCDDCYELETT